MFGVVCNVRSWEGMRVNTMRAHKGDARAKREPVGLTH
jgi:hypothetical protein